MDRNEIFVNKKSEIIHNKLDEDNCKEESEHEESNLTSPVIASNINSDEIDKETITKLRGDAIGDTMYSETFVIKTLLYLNDMTWNKKVEEDLCFLWDMTVEKDVCEYLYKLSFPSLACAGLLKYDEPRLVEIVVGILANIICSESSSVIKPEEIEIILGWLNTDDSLILIQIMRFLKALSFKSTSLHFMTADMIDKVNFILNNSTNKELLMLTLDVISKITVDSKLKANLISGAILNSSVNAYFSVSRTGKEDVLDECEWEADKQTVLTYLVEIILNFCAYINISDNDQLFHIVKKHSSKLITEFSEIFSYFSNSNNLLPLNENFKFYVEAFTVIFPVLSISYNSDIFVNLCNIIQLLKENIEDISCFIELLQYLISVANVQCIKSDFDRCDCDVVQILNLSVQQKCESNIKFEENVNILLNNYKNTK